MHIELGPNQDFQHVGDAAKNHVEVVNGVKQPPYQLRHNAAGTARDTVMTHFNTKGYDQPILAGECILMGMITNCTHLRKVCFRGSEAGDIAPLMNMKTGDPALDADGNEIALNDCVLDVGETAAAWPASDVFIARVDCPVRDQDGALTGVCLLEAAAGEVAQDGFEGRAIGEIDGCYAIVVIPSADVPDLATLWLDIEIANGFAR